jgi:hypothetical protein
MDVQKLYELNKYITCKNAIYPDQCNKFIKDYNFYLSYCTVCGTNFCRDEIFESIDNILIANGLPLGQNLYDKIVILKDNYKKCKNES